MKSVYFTMSLFLLSVSLATQAKNFYRYTNSDGAVVIKDKVTQNMERVGYDVISEQGKLIEHIDASKTLAEIAAERQKEVERKNKLVEQERQRHRDADLLRQFTSIGDIIRNRDSQLLSLERSIKIQHSKEELLKLQLEDQQQQAATYERLGQKVASSLSKDIQASQDQIAGTHTSTELLEKEKTRVEKSFEKDIVRFKELESVRLALRKDARKNRDSEPAIFDCPDERSCNRAWQLAQIYARDHATGKIEIITNSLILTSRPIEALDVAISFSRIPAPEDKMQIILEVSCSTEEDGVAFCKTDKIKQIRQSYLNYLKMRMKH